MDKNKTSSPSPIIDHIGIAVNSLEPAIERWAALLGGQSSGRETVESEGVNVAFFGEGSGRVELLAPMNEDSPIARFIKKRGGGLHHICVRVSDLETVLEQAEARGIEPIPPRIRKGSSGSRISFVHPQALDGVLLELREETDE
jgi:methylmalonyl-CoA/ethylmalonyl-CoA epimerase